MNNNLKLPIHELFYSKAGTIDTFDIEVPAFEDSEIKIHPGQKIRLMGIKIDDGICLYSEGQTLTVEYACNRCLKPVVTKLQLVTLEKQYYVTIPEDMDSDLAEEVESKNFEVDLTSLLKETVFLSLDPILTCGEDCPGMPDYGAIPTEPTSKNPFSNLKDLLK
jgi:uncharacterized metal-binding protein YceD (DUF177 family)